jgi:hypothetical protein
MCDLSIELVMAHNQFNFPKPMQDFFDVVLCVEMTAEFALLGLYPEF